MSAMGSVDDDDGGGGDVTRGRTCVWILRVKVSYVFHTKHNGSREDIYLAVLNLGSVCILQKLEGFF